MASQKSTHNSRLPGLILTTMMTMLIHAGALGGNPAILPTKWDTRQDRKTMLVMLFSPGVKRTPTEDNHVAAQERTW
jgi:hypothetical protein